GLLDAQSATVLGLPALLTGLVLAAAGMWVGGQRVRRSTYRPDPWRAPEWATAACGLAAAAAVLWVGYTDPSALTAPLHPLAVPALPLVATAGILAAGLAAIVSPVPLSTASTTPIPVSPPVTERAQERPRP
ncbi:MAG TPA: hypothetical protein VF317_07775, partial [Dermatophilaceae bacterium]